METWAEAMQNEPSKIDPQLKPPLRTYYPKFKICGGTVHHKQINSLANMT